MHFLVFMAPKKKDDNWSSGGTLSASAKRYVWEESALRLGRRLASEPAGDFGAPIAAALLLPPACAQAAASSAEACP